MKKSHSMLHFFFSYPHNKKGCNENLYFHLFEKPSYLMNQLSIFKNCVYLFMKLESYEFGLIALCWENLFIYEKNLLNDVLNNVIKLNMLFFTQTFTKCFQIYVNFNILHKKVHMSLCQNIINMST